MEASNCKKKKVGIHFFKALEVHLHPVLLFTVISYLGFFQK